MSIEVDYINPMVSGLEDVFKTMLDCSVHRTGIDLMENSQALHPVSGIVGVTGQGVVGTVVLSMERQVAIKAAQVMLMMEDIAQVDNDVLDAVGELANMICGEAKAKLAQFRLNISLPNVLCGDDCWLHFPQTSRPIKLPFKCQWGMLAIQVGFSFPSMR